MLVSFGCCWQDKFSCPFGSCWVGAESRRGRVAHGATGISPEATANSLCLAEGRSQKRSLLARLLGSSWILSGGKQPVPAMSSDWAFPTSS